MYHNEPVFINHGFISTDQIKHHITDVISWEDGHRGSVYGAQLQTKNIQFVWTPVLDEETFYVYEDLALINSPIGKEYTKITEQVLNIIPGTILRGTLVVLPPGREIPLHIDGYHELWVKCHRVHLPIVTESSVVFFYESKFKHLKENELIEINNIIPHGVSHGGAENRYHLMYDILPATYSGNFSIIKHNDIHLFHSHCEREVTEHLTYKNVKRYSFN